MNKKLLIVACAAFLLGDLEACVRTSFVHARETRKFKKANAILGMQVIALSNFIKLATEDPDEAVRKFETDRDFINILDDGY